MSGPYTGYTPLRDDKHIASRHTTQEDTLKNMGVDIAKSTHPDGKPWAKCCRGHTTTSEAPLTKLNPDVFSEKTILNCAYIDKRLVHKCQNDFFNEQKETPFTCCHRLDEGYTRICAGWHACNGHTWTPIDWQGPVGA